MKVRRWILSLAVAWQLAAFAPSAHAQIVANSITDWSTTGTQGENGWTYGWYNYTADSALDPILGIPGDGTYGNEPEDFTPFENPAHWDGQAWDIPPNPPWIFLGQDSAHPNGSNNMATNEGWVIRRYTVPAEDVASSNSMAVLWRLRAENLGGGTGTSGRLFHNGSEMDSAAIGGVDAVGVARSVYLPNVQAGDTIDLALTSVGPTGEAHDGSDGSLFRMKIRNNATEFTPFVATPATPVVPLADSAAEFSGVQGQNGWRYGLYNLSADGNATFDQASDFTEFVAEPTVGVTDFHWTGSSWDNITRNGDGSTTTVNPPWTQLTNVGGHPNGVNNGVVHWAVRRWVSDVSGPVTITGLLNNLSANGDGTTGRIIVDGVEVYSAITDGTSEQFSVETHVNLGSLVDFIIDPQGVDLTNLNNDGADTTTFQATIDYQVIATEVANSQADFSLTQGENNWHYGYWNRTADEAAADGDGVYNPVEFVELDSVRGGGSAWGLVDDGAPWTFITPETMHPNGTNNGEAHWVVRRWESEVDGPVLIEGNFNRGAGADGNVGRIFINGDEVFAQSLGGAAFSLKYDVNAGDLIDFVVDAGYNDQDGSDGTSFHATISSVSVVPEPAMGTVALLSVLGGMALVRRRRVER